ncbi:MAG: DUF2178 domain-containing protein [Candidatus Pacebacteria bacterium]|nr:DUF2178 domain-containing protein [Candidatus Paceibacterota bacterium]
MNEKTYTIIKLLTVMLLAITVSVSVVAGNYILPIIATLAALVLLWTTKKKVATVLEDELDYKVAGDAARYSIFIFSIGSVVLALYFMANRTQNSAFELLGSVFAYSASFLILLQSIIFKILRNKNYGSEKNDNKD